MKRRNTKWPGLSQGRPGFFHGRLAHALLVARTPLWVSQPEPLARAAAAA